MATIEIGQIPFYPVSAFMFDWNSLLISSSRCGLWVWTNLQVRHIDLAHLWPHYPLVRHDATINLPLSDRWMRGRGWDYWPERHCPASSARVVSHWLPNASLNIYAFWLVYVIVNWMTYTVARNGHWLNRSHNAGGSPALLQQEREGGIISGGIKMICPGHRSGWCSDCSLAAALPIEVCDWKHLR